MLILKLVSSAEQISTSLANFATGVEAHPEVARGLFTSTSFWVYDPASGTFGPSKFVGFRDMTFEQYEAAQKGDSQGDHFDSHDTRTRIGKVLGAIYSSDASLAEDLRRWVDGLWPD